MSAATPRDGTVLVLVLGLITLLMALLAGLAARVHNAGRSLETLRRHAQAIVMLQAAKIYIAERAAGPSGPLTGAATLGDTLAANSLPAAFFADRLGWVHVLPDPAAGPGTYRIISAGGGSTTPGTGKASLNSGNPMANAYEIRYLHIAVFTAPGSFVLTARPVGNYTSSW